MTNDSTVTKLLNMRLSTMAEHYREQLKSNSYSELTFEERFSLLVDLEWDKRRSNKLDRLIKKATFKFPYACLEDVECIWQVKNAIKGKEKYNPAQSGFYFSNACSFL